MKTPRVAVALLIALAPCTLVVPAAAQTGADDTTTTMARARFKEGVDFYDKGEYDQARASFLQAYALKKHPAVLLNLAWSCVKSGHALEGKKYFEQFLAEGKDITDKQRADANDGLTQARGKLGRIEIQATSGTDVTIDGEKVGTAPLSDPVVVEAGAHTVKFKGSDGSSDTQSVSVLGGQKAVAHFPQSASGAAPVPAPVPANTAATPAPDATSATPASSPPADATPAPAPAAKEAPSSSSHASILTPPDNIIPAVVLGGVGVIGIVGGIIMAASKSSAQDNANQLGAKIEANGGPGANPTAFAAYNSDLNDVNTDATLANVGIGVGIAGLVGFGLYWALASKTSSDSAVLHTPVVTPMIGRSSGGLSFGASF
jgi:Tfp pilus assembly protein PilF